jgi:hypothetical protein
MLNIIEFLIENKVQSALEHIKVSYEYEVEVSSYTSEHADTVYYIVKVKRKDKRFVHNETYFYVDAFPLVDLEKTLEVAYSLTLECVKAMKV